MIAVRGLACDKNASRGLYYEGRAGGGGGGLTGDIIWEEKSREERPSIKYLSSDKLIRPASGPPLIFVQLPREAGKARK